MRRIVTVRSWFPLAACAIAFSFLAGCSGEAQQRHLASEGARLVEKSSYADRAIADSTLSVRRVDAMVAEFPRGALVSSLPPPSPGPLSEEELWIIERPQAIKPPSEEETPSSGALMAMSGGREIPLPLKHTGVKAQISGYVATVEVTQQFHNPYDGKIEAVYLFPLPQDAAVNEFLMVIGDRRIRGIIREREEAVRIYHEARRQGYVASLLTQERPNIFTQSVANIEPQVEIDVTIVYFHTLAYAGGWYEYVFPMVVGPRFNPPGATDGIGAVARGTRGGSGQRIEVQYLKPGERSGHDISLAVAIDAGVPIEEVASVNHVIEKEFAAPERVTVTLSLLDAVPNKDFVLRYKVAGKQIKSGLMTHRDERGGFFTLMLYPPESLSSIPAAPLEMIFVLDCSGSMSGVPIAKAKSAIARALRSLRPEDSFQLIQFSTNASQLGPDPVPATRENVRRGLAYLESLQGSGGTMMIEGIKAALDFAHDPERFRIVSFMTDGYIGNEAEIFAEVQKRLGASRIFSFGVGTSVNRYLLEGLARLGKGAVAYVSLDENPSEAVDLFYERIRHAALTDIAIEATGQMEIADLHPRRVPDLFVGRPVAVTGRFSGHGAASIRIKGSAGGAPKEILLAADLDDAAGRHPGIPSIWARKQIEVLADLSACDLDRPYPEGIKRIALEFNLVSAYTAFVAVDSKTRTEGDHGTTVPVAVPVPEGVRYDTTVVGGG